jgi:transcriptional regulator with XRE-family HTH domain
MKSKREVPYLGLGEQLKKVRQNRRETIAEVSGAIEVEADYLRDVEAGLNRPSEEIMMLLISYFGLSDIEADKLWNLGGYENIEPDVQNDQNFNKPGVSVLPSDVRIVYTDTVHVVVNNFGVVMNFMQMGGPIGQPLMVSRVGMSKDHARSVLEVLKQTLDQSENPSVPKLIANPKNVESKHKKHSNEQHG